MQRCKAPGITVPSHKVLAVPGEVQYSGILEGLGFYIGSLGYILGGI